jgi:hypothetical protein
MNEDARFTIISLNVRGLANTTHKNKLTMFLTTHKPSVLILEEPQIDYRTTITRKRKTMKHTPVPVPNLQDMHHYISHIPPNQQVWCFTSTTHAHTNHYIT